MRPYASANVSADAIGTPTRDAAVRVVRRWRPRPVVGVPAHQLRSRCLSPRSTRALVELPTRLAVAWRASAFRSGAPRLRGGVRETLARPRPPTTRRLRGVRGLRDLSYLRDGLRASSCAPRCPARGGVHRAPVAWRRAYRLAYRARARQQTFAPPARARENVLRPGRRVRDGWIALCTAIGYRVNGFHPISTLHRRRCGRSRCARRCLARMSCAHDRRDVESVDRGRVGVWVLAAHGAAGVGCRSLAPALPPSSGPVRRAARGPAPRHRRRCGYGRGTRIRRRPMA